MSSYDTRSIVSLLLSPLTSSTGMQALAWANNINKRLALAADGEPQLAAATAAAATKTQGRRSSHSSNSAGRGQRRNPRPVTASVGGAATRLLAAVAAGTAVLEVARPEVRREYQSGRGSERGRFDLSGRSTSEELLELMVQLSFCRFILWCGQREALASILNRGRSVKVYVPGCRCSFVSRKRRDNEEETHPNRGLREGILGYSVCSMAPVRLGFYLANKIEDQAFASPRIPLPPLSVLLVFLSGAIFMLVVKPRQQIFRPGCKVVLGSGASVGQEGRFVTAVVGSVEAGGREPARPEAEDAGGGGYVVLEVPVKLDHIEGTRVVNGRPGRVEAAAYRKRQVRSLQVL